MPVRKDEQGPGLYAAIRNVTGATVTFRDNREK